MARLVLKDVTQALCRAMHHPESLESPIRLNENEAGRNAPQAISSLSLGPYGFAKVPLHKCYRFIAANDFDRPADLKERQSREEAREPQHMVEVGVSQQHIVQSAEAQVGAQDLALSAFTAINQKAIRTFGNEQRRQASLGRGHCGSGTKKYQLEHDSRRAAVIISACGRLGRLAPPKRGPAAAGLWGGMALGRRIVTWEYRARTFGALVEAFGELRCIVSFIGAVSRLWLSGAYSRQ